MASETVQDPDFIARLQIPMLFVAAGADAVVSTPAIEHYVRQIKSASLLTIDGARHEIWQEADIYREQLLAAFDAFMPGSDPAPVVVRWRHSKQHFIDQPQQPGLGLRPRNLQRLRPTSASFIGAVQDAA